MKKIYQDKENCFLACVASILQIDLSELDFLSGFNTEEENKEFSDLFNDWLKKRGLTYIEYRIATDENGPIMTRFYPVDVHIILTGPSNKFDNIDHSVVGKWTGYSDEGGEGFAFLHDPAGPESTGIAEIKYVGIFVRDVLK